MPDVRAIAFVLGSNRLVDESQLSYRLDEFLIGSQPQENGACQIFDPI